MVTCTVRVARSTSPHREPVGLGAGRWQVRAGAAGQLLISLVVVAGEFSQFFEVADPDLFAGYPQHSGFLETRQYATDSLGGQPEITGDIPPGHRQDKFAIRIAAAGKALGK